MSVKVSNNNMNQIMDELKRQNIDISQFDMSSLVNKGIVSSNTSSSYQFKDKNGEFWRATLNWKSVNGGVKRDDSKEMTQFKDHFEDGKKKFGSLVETTKG